MRFGRSVALFATLAAVSPAVLRAAAAPTTWNLELARGKFARSTVTVRNRCKAPHLFELSRPPGMRWLEFPTGTALEVAAGGMATVDARIDTAGLDVGEYEGDVSVRCRDCAAEPLCAQDLDVFRARLKVLWPPEERTSLDPQEYAPGELLAVIERDAAGSRALSELAKRHGLRVLRSFELPSISRAVAVFEMPSADSPVPDLLGRLERDPGVRFAQPNFLYAVARAEGGDPYENLQYGARLIGAERARRLATGRGVKVAVLDSRVESGHSDLSAAEAESRDFFYEDRWRRNEVHGTEMTGAIAARAGNGVGISGIAPEAAVLAIRVCGARSERGPETCVTEAISRGIDLAVQRAARVVNMSLAGPYDPLVARLVHRAIEGGATVVAAAGNNGPEGKPRYPAALEPVLAVSAVGEDKRLYASANRGSHVDVVAAGVEVLTTSPGNAFRPSTGTSVATAQVSGVVALLVQLRPEIAPEEVRALLESTARDLGAPGRDPLYGAGLVDVCAAIAKLSGGKTACP